MSVKTAEQSHLEFLFNHTIDMIWSIDVDMNLTCGNKAFKEYFTNITGVNDAIGQNLLHPSLPKKTFHFWKANYTRALGGDQFVVEVSNELEADQYHKISFNPIIAESGAIAGIACTASNITAYKIKELELERAHEELKSNERHYRSLAENFPNGNIGILDLNFNFRYAAGADLTLYGIDGNTLIGTNYINNFEPENQSHVQANMAEVLNGKMATFEVSFTNFSYIVNAVPLLDKNSEMEEILLVAQNITEQKNIEIALRESEEKFRMLSENSPVGIFQITPEGQCTWMNERLCEIFGFQMEQGLGFGYVSYFHPRDIEQIKEIWEYNALDAKTKTLVPYRIMAFDRKVKWVYIQATPLKDENGEVTAYVGTVEDVSEIKWHQEELLASRNELEQTVENRTAQLVANNIEMEGFNYTVSHDLSTPLRAIQMFVTLLEKECATNVVCLEYAQNIKTCTDEMVALINSLMGLSRLRKQELACTKLDMRQLATETAAYLLSLEDRKDINIKIKKLHTAYGDPTLIKSVWQNLISNAIKYSQYSHPASIIITSVVINNFVQYCIEDNGIGFDMKYADKLFKPFSRLHSGTDYKGTGAGLAIVERIISRHNGEISVTSEPNKGSKFYFSLSIPSKK
ncbi:hypothetical protein BH09BAC1_BH09BAC1_09570 [soil metagenome]